MPSAYSQNVVALVPSEHPRTDVRLVREKYTPLPGPQGLPMFKPPYGRLTAIDLNRGDIAWQVPNGEGPRDHPAIQHLDLPPGPPYHWGNAETPVLPPSPRNTRELVMSTDARPGWPSGDVVWEMELPGGTSGAPMTYMIDGRQYIIATVGWDDMASELVAFALPE